MTEWLNGQNPHHLQRAGALLKAGKLVAVPTETVYGLAADATNPQAVSNIFAAKGRPSNHPLITHVSSIEQVWQWASNVPPWAERLLNAFWPGPLTLLLEKQSQVSDVITGGLPTIGLRMPAHPLLLKLMQDFELTLAAPSANPYQKLSPTTADQVMAGMGGKISGILDGGPCAVGLESTILLARMDSATILRRGPITAKALEEHLPFKVQSPEMHSYEVSGNKKVHYRPNAKVFIKTTEAILDFLDRPKPGVGCLVYSPMRLKQYHQFLTLPADPIKYRRAFYASLHELDTRDFLEIWVEQPPLGSEWEDIWDRLSRAAVNLG